MQHSAAAQMLAQRQPAGLNCTAVRDLLGFPRNLRQAGIRNLPLPNVSVVNFRRVIILSSCIVFFVFRTPRPLCKFGEPRRALGCVTRRSNRALQRLVACCSMCQRVHLCVCKPRRYLTHEEKISIFRAAEKAGALQTMHQLYS